MTGRLVGGLPQRGAELRRRLAGPALGEGLVGAVGGLGLDVRGGHEGGGEQEQQQAGQAAHETSGGHSDPPAAPVPAAVTS